MTAPPRAQLVIHFADGTNGPHAATQLRKAGWDAWERESRRRRRSDGVVVEAWTSRLRGEKFEVADAVATQARELLGDFSIRSMEVRVHPHAPTRLLPWQVVAANDLSKSDAAVVAERAGGYLLYGPQEFARARTARLFENSGLPAGSWTLQTFQSWPEQMRRRNTIIPVAIALAAAAAGVGLGYLLAPLSGPPVASASAAFVVTAAGMVVMLAAALVGARPRGRVVKGVALTVLLLGIIGVLLGPTLATVRLGLPWVSPAALGAVAVALIVQALVTTTAFARMRMAVSPIPLAVVVTALGLTVFIIVLNLPIASFYNAAGQPDLIGTASWGTVIGTGIVFAGAIVLAAGFACWALSRWRAYATLFRVRLLFGLLMTCLLAAVAFLALGASISDGQLAREGEYGTRPHSEWMYAVCIADPKNAGEHTPLWLLGTDGRTTVLLDRSRMTGAQPVGDNLPHYVDSTRPLKYVDPHQSC